jgi:2'-5' RNA ligase superfamily
VSEQRPAGPELYGIVSLLDERHDELMRALWQDMEHEFGLPPVADTLIPHFSYHVAERYEQERLRSDLSRLADETSPFPARGRPFGIHSGDQVVFFLPIVRSRAFGRLHENIWREVEPIATGSYQRYHPDQLLLGIALTPDGLNRTMLPAVADFLAGRDLAWDIEVNNLSLLHDTGRRQELAYSIPFSQ